MPAPWRLALVTVPMSMTSGFNLKRDASPVATIVTPGVALIALVFQSQARCQPRGDQGTTLSIPRNSIVSISSEMPAPWRLLDLVKSLYLYLQFQSQARCQPRGDHLAESPGRYSV